MEPLVLLALRLNLTTPSLHLEPHYTLLALRLNLTTPLTFAGVALEPHYTPGVSCNHLATLLVQP
jgi:hypothetical protein